MEPITFDCVATTTLSESPFKGPPGFASKSTDGQTILFSNRQGQVRAVAPDLTVLLSLDEQRRIDEAAIASDGRSFAISGNHELSLLSIGGETLRSLPHDPWNEYGGGGCVFQPGTSWLWAVIPGGVEADEPQLILIDHEKWQVTDRCPVPVDHDYGFHLSVHPEGQVIFVWAGAGQDGQETFWADAVGGRIRLFENPFLRDMGWPVFSPDGGRFVVLDHENSIREFEFATGALLSTARGAEVCIAIGADPREDQLSLEMQYAADDTLVVISSCGWPGLVHLRAGKSDPLRLRGYAVKRHARTWKTGGAITAESWDHGDLHNVLLLSNRQLITSHYMRNDLPYLKLWDTSPLHAPLTLPDPKRPYTQKLLDNRGR